jgi:hypothetical protein
MTDSSQAYTLPADTGAGAVSDAGRSQPSTTRLHGRRLLLARWAWAAAAAVVVGLYVLLLPACLAQLQSVCSGASCAQVQPSPSGAHALHQLGFSLGSYAALTFALLLLQAVFCFIVAGVIVWRKSDDWMALVVALSLMAGGTQLVPYLLETGRSPWQLLAITVNTLDFALLFLLFAIFPSGHFVPRWTRWMVVGWVAASVALVVSYIITGELRFIAYALVWLAAVGCVTGAQVYRYRDVSGPREQAQTRWVVFGAVSAVVIVFAVEAPAFLVPLLGRSGSLYRLLSAPVLTLPVILLSVCVGMAILRDRLYDIDVIIRRTLVYGLVTGTLAAVYFGSVVLLQAGFQAVTGQGSPAAVVVSTLAIFALFQPLRRQVQAAVDRRFYRRKFDAARTLAAFSAVVQSELDLAELSAQLTTVVTETMQPAHVSLWLTALEHESDHRSASAEPSRERPTSL